jgi:hypothetical protein
LLQISTVTTCLIYGFSVSPAVNRHSRSSPVIAITVGSQHFGAFQTKHLAVVTQFILLATDYRMLPLDGIERVNLLGRDTEYILQFTGRDSTKPAQIGSIHGTQHVGTV